jgi:uncharacterized protein (UPF0332 family)
VNESEKLNEKLLQMITKAERSMTASRRLYNEGDYDFAASRAYYATFYMMQAALLTKQITPSQHGTVISRFNEHFVKTGIFPKEFGRFISRLFRERQTGDYGYSITIDQVESEEDIKFAEQIFQTVRTYW